MNKGNRGTTGTLQVRRKLAARFVVRRRGTPRFTSMAEPLQQMAGLADRDSWVVATGNRDGPARQRRRPGLKGTDREGMFNFFDGWLVRWVVRADQQVPKTKQKAIPTIDVTLKQPARARLITGDSRQIPVPVSLRYVSADPLAVHVHFLPHVFHHDRSMIWTFARDLLAEGLRAPAGIGDVRIWPCGSFHTIVELDTVEGLAMVRFETAVLRRFLHDSYKVVAAGREETSAALELSLASLLDGV